MGEGRPVAYFLIYPSDKASCLIWSDPILHGFSIECLGPRSGERRSHSTATGRYGVIRRVTRGEGQDERKKSRLRITSQPAIQESDQKGSGFRFQIHILQVVANFNALRGERVLLRPHRDRVVSRWKIIEVIIPRGIGGGRSFYIATL